jgi:hypothetical protein
MLLTYLLFGKVFVIFVLIRCLSFMYLNDSFLVLFDLMIFVLITFVLITFVLMTFVLVAFVLMTILGEMVNLPKSRHQQYQPEHFSHFMYGLTFWQVDFLEVEHFPLYLCK